MTKVSGHVWSAVFGLIVLGIILKTAWDMVGPYIPYGIIAVILIAGLRFIITRRRTF